MISHEKPRGEMSVTSPSGGQQLAVSGAAVTCLFVHFRAELCLGSGGALLGEGMG